MQNDGDDSLEIELELQWTYLGIGVLVLAGTVAGYTVIQSEPGVEVSCAEHEILEFRTAYPRLLDTGTPACEVRLIVRNMTSGHNVCDVRKQVYNDDNGVVGCPALADLDGEKIDIVTAYFRPGGNTSLGTDREFPFYTPNTQRNY